MYPPFFKSTRAKFLCIGLGIFYLATLPLPSYAQLWNKILSITNLKKSPENKLPINTLTLQNGIMYDCSQLSTKSMGGRVLGTRGNILAGKYIAKAFNSYGVVPFGDKFAHLFWYISGVQLTKNTRLTIGDEYIFMPEEAFPAPYSANGDINNFILPDSRELGQPWIIPLYQNQGEASDSRFNWVSETYKRAKNAQNRGASAVIFYCNFESRHKPIYGENYNLKDLDIPVIIVGNKAYLEKIKDIKVLTSISLQFDYKNQYKKGANIVGYIYNGAPLNVLVCAHYDGHPSAALTGNANDNASGVAAMMALARLIKAGDFQKYNYIFTALSGGTANQAGSKALLEDKSIEKNKIAYVINLDRVGHLNQKDQLYVNGVKFSSVLFKSLVSSKDGLAFIFDNKEVSASDYIPFIKHRIPALSFSTTLAESPSLKHDGLKELNILGMTQVVALVYHVMAAIEQQHRPVFASEVVQQNIARKYHSYHNQNILNRHNTSPNTVSNTRENNTQRTRLIRTIGLKCDTSYDGYGVRILNVKKGFVAEKAGLKPGDIIMQMGGDKINDIQDYANVLNSLKPGANITVRVKRGPTAQNFTL